ncbi:helix-turn-helix transcriptional regulator [Bacillaceae bacterium S4-13-58]
MEDKSIGIIIGRIIRKKRKDYQKKDKKWTQEYVAEQADVDYPHYGKFERGKIEQPQFLTIAKLADVLNMSLDEIWEEYEIEKQKYLEEEDRKKQ